MEATTRRLPPVLQIEAKAKISALLSDLEMKAYYLSTEHNVSIASPHQSTSSPLQSTSFNIQTNNMMPTVSPSKPMDFSTNQHRIIAHCTTDTSTSEGQIEIFGIDNNLYTFQ